MSGNLDRPLGIPKEKKVRPRHGFIFYSIFAIGLVATGFAATRLLDLVIPKPPVQVTTVSLGSDQQLDTAIPDRKAKGKIIAKRPDLPINENGPGLEELNASGKLEIPTIVPRKRSENIEKKQILAHLPDSELTQKSSYGLLPVVSPDGLRPLDMYSRLPDTEGNFGVARIVIIVGGLGISQTSTDQAIRSLPAGVTLAFAPYGNSLSRWMQMARQNGHELLMQVPMEPFGYPQTNAGNHSLLSSAGEQKNRENLLWTLGRITNYVGVMNYLGGKMLSSPDKLAPIFEEFSSRGLMFVDDGSIRNSKAAQMSKSSGTPFTRAHMTIDSLRTRTAIAKKLEELESKAKKTGLAIGVATAFPESISLIAKFLKNAKSRGLELTPVSAIATQFDG